MAALMFGCAAALYIVGCLRDRGDWLNAAGLFALAGCVLIK